MQVNPSEVQTGFGGTESKPKRANPERAENPSKLNASDIANLIASMLELDDHGFVTESTIWATNPK
jgi:3-oxoacyl-[acyl-carrier protein] reductase